MTVAPAPSRTASLLAQLLLALSQDERARPPFSVEARKLRDEAETVRGMLARRERGTT